MRCEDKCALATMVCIDCGVCSAHAFFGPGSAGECMACTADRIRKGQEKRMSKTLSPPEVVQALLDGKTVAFSGNLFRYQDGCFASRPQNNPAGPPWRDVAWRAADLLEAFINSPPWSVVPETYDWAEARKRMRVSGKRCRPVSVDYSFYADGGRYFVSGGGPFEWRDDFFDGEWTDA